MFKFIIKRVLQAIPVLIIVASLTFFMIRVAPGGPFSTDKAVSSEVLTNINEHYGLNKPVLYQYYDYMLSLFKGDLGPSYKYSSRTVNEVIAGSFPVSLELGIFAMLFAIIVGIAFGVIAAIKPNSLRDYMSMSFVMIGICVPAFVLGPVLIWFFAIKLEWFNVTGWSTVGDMVLPTITLGAIYVANIARLSRGGMLEILSQDFIRTARAKGLPEKVVIIKHALRGGLLSVISYLGPAIAGVITGSFVVETIFQVPGLGRVFVQAAFNRDYTMIVGTVVFYSLIIVILNIIVDILQIWLDPRRSFE